MNIQKLGWNESLQNSFLAIENAGQYTVGRVMLEHKRLYRVATETSEVLAEVSGKFRFEATSREDFPAVGDGSLLVCVSRKEKERSIIFSPALVNFLEKPLGKIQKNKL